MSRVVSALIWELFQRHPPPARKPLSDTKNWQKQVLEGILTMLLGEVVARRRNAGSFGSHGRSDSLKSSA
jgi:hypothetical protein